MAAYKFSYNGVVRLVDGASIPADLHNSDWRVYLAYVAGGGATDPQFSPAEQAEIDARSVEQAARLADKAAMLGDSTVALLASKTPAQIDAYIVANVNDFGSAKSVIRALAQVCGVLARSSQ